LTLDNKLMSTKNLANIIYMIKSLDLTLCNGHCTKVGSTTRITQNSLSIAKYVASFLI